jgi:hypothetical protein
MRWLDEQPEFPARLFQDGGAAAPDNRLQSVQQMLKSLDEKLGQTSSERETEYEKLGMEEPMVGEEGFSDVNFPERTI